MTHAPALAELQQNLQALQSQLEADSAVAIAQGLALCQNFETHKQRYLPASWLPTAPPNTPMLSSLEAVPYSTSLKTNSDPSSQEVSQANQGEKTGEEPSKKPGNTSGKDEEGNGKNAVEKGSAIYDLSTAPVSTAPEEQMLSHYVELTKHMRLLAADFTMFRAARNPSTQKSRRQQIQQRLAVLLTYCQYLLATSA